MEVRDGAHQVHDALALLGVSDSNRTPIPGLGLSQWARTGLIHTTIPGSENGSPSSVANATSSSVPTGSGLSDWMKMPISLMLVM